MKGSPEQLEQRRVNDAWRRYKEARQRLDELMDKNRAVFEEAYTLSENVNMARKKLDQACRETGIGVGPITVSAVRSPVFDVSYLEKILNGNPVLGDLIKIEKKVDRKIFEGLISEGALTQAQIRKAILEEKSTYRLTGIPDEIVLP